MKSRGCHHLTTFSTSYLFRLFVVLGDSFSPLELDHYVVWQQPMIAFFFFVFKVRRLRCLSKANCNWLQTLSRWLEKVFSLPFLFRSADLSVQVWFVKQTRRQLQPKLKYISKPLSPFRFYLVRIPSFLKLNDVTHFKQWTLIPGRVKANFHRNFSKAKTFLWNFHCENRYFLPSKLEELCTCISALSKTKQIAFRLRRFYFSIGSEQEENIFFFLFALSYSQTRLDWLTLFFRSHCAASPDDEVKEKLCL